MGKLHRIRRAFNKLPEEMKRKLSRYGGGSCHVGWHGVSFSLWGRSYRKYVKKLCREYFGEVAQGD